EEVAPCEGAEALAQGAQGSCGCPIPGSVQAQIGHRGLEQPAPVEGVLARGTGWNWSLPTRTILRGWTPICRWRQAAALPPAEVCGPVSTGHGPAARPQRRGSCPARGGRPAPQALPPVTPAPKHSPSPATRTSRCRGPSHRSAPAANGHRAPPNLRPAPRNRFPGATRNWRWPRRVRAGRGAAPGAMFVTVAALAKSKSKYILVRMKSAAETGYCFNVRRPRLQQKLVLYKYDPIAKQRVLFTEMRKIRSI
uniref:Large ribosomal subunit protein bL33m n=1 Tax=Amazona collaria TaxID=241587 RepID=A0A8B9GFA3_9PSIT